jgi:hypothetical protein
LLAYHQTQQFSFQPIHGLLLLALLKLNTWWLLAVAVAVWGEVLQAVVMVVEAVVAQALLELQQDWLLLREQLIP